MAKLRPCTECLRHVRGTDTQCPFCDAKLASDDGIAVTPGRLGRAAQMAFGAAIASAALTGCDNTKPAQDPTTTDVGVPTEPTGAPTTTATAPPTATATAPPTATAPNPAKPYGAPPADGWLV